MIAAELAVTSKVLTPEEISNLVGLPYDRAYRIGDRRGRSPLIWDENVWSLTEVANVDEDPRDSDEILNECIDKLCARVGKKTEAFRKLAKTEDVTLLLCISDQDVPILEYSPARIQFVCDLGAKLAIDLILIASDEEELTSD